MIYCFISLPEEGEGDTKGDIYPKREVYTNAEEREGEVYPQMGGYTDADEGRTMPPGGVGLCGGGSNLVTARSRGGVIALIPYLGQFRRGRQRAFRN
jgi:hypothetical protein